ncbi:MAG: hypothetical protein ACREQW_23845 [Candidatus Binatia bacterium]
MPRFTMRSIASGIPWQLFLAIKRVILVCLFLSCWVSQSSAAAGPVRVELETVPPLDEITPLSEPTRLVLALLDSERKPIAAGRARIRLEAPGPGWFFSTDLPTVEGKGLVEIEFPISNGTVDWEYLFPIRGVYRLEVTTFDTKGERAQRVFRLPVKESRLKLFYLATFVTALFVLGFCMGWWLNRGRRRF